MIDPTPDMLGIMLMGGFGVLAIPVGWVFRRLGRREDTAVLRAAPVSRGAAAPAPPPVAASQDHGSFRPPAKTRPTHWLMRSVSILAGVVIFFFGCLALNSTVKLFLRAANAPEHGALSLTIHAAMIGIMAGVTLLGAFLVRKGMKRKRPALRFQG